MGDVLTLDRIAELLATTKQRGTYFVDIENHVKSGDLACDFSELSYYKGKDAAAVRNSINLNIEKHGKKNNWPAMSVLLDKSNKDDVHVILVNMDVLAAQQAAQADDNE
jgi:hypothetical protein